MTRAEKLKNQRQYRMNNNNACTKKYEKTVNGFLMRAYRNMESRIMGIQKKKFHLYKGLCLLSREDFYKWAKSSQDFWKLWHDWVASNYNRKITPSTNRINPRIGYDLGNMEWITQSENSRLGNFSKRFHQMESIRRLINE